LTGRRVTGICHIFSFVHYLNCRLPKPDYARLGRLTRLQVETAAELDALLPAILDRAFNGEL